MRFSRLSRVLGGWPRRLLALVCLLGAGLSAVHAAGPKPRDAAVDAPAVVSTRTIPAGAVLVGDDVRIAQWPSVLRPVAAISLAADAIGHRSATSIGPGELITTSRLVGSDLGASLPTGMVAVPVPLVDPGAASLIHAGNRVDLLSPPNGTSAPQAQVVASSVLVLAIVAASPAGPSSSAQLVVAVDSATELRIAQAITTPMLATVVKPP